MRNLQTIEVLGSANRTITKRLGQSVQSQTNKLIGQGRKGKDTFNIANNWQQQ